VQTFLPYADFKETALVLDYRRLGKQRVEAYQIVRVLDGTQQSNAWHNHPAVLMWRDNLDALKSYGREICLEWIRRGYNDNLITHFQHKPAPDMPAWLGDERIHISHQANLVRKLPEHYRLHFPTVDETMPYHWPITKENLHG